LRQTLVGQLKIVIFQIWLGRRNPFNCPLQRSELHRVAPRRLGSERQIGDHPKNEPAPFDSLNGPYNVSQMGDSHPRALPHAR
jgi:hypothetical protein